MKKRTLLTIAAILLLPLSIAALPTGSNLPTDIYKFIELHVGAQIDTTSNLDPNAGTAYLQVGNGNIIAQGISDPGGVVSSTFTFDQGADGAINLGHATAIGTDTPVQVLNGPWFAVANIHSTGSGTALSATYVAETTNIVGASFDLINNVALGANEINTGLRSGMQPNVSDALSAFNRSFSANDISGANATEIAYHGGSGYDASLYLESGIAIFKDYNMNFYAFNANGGASNRIRFTIDDATTTNTSAGNFEFIGGDSGGGTGQPTDFDVDLYPGAHFNLNNGLLLLDADTAPSISACGPGASISGTSPTAMAFSVVVGNTPSPTTCVVNFGTTWPNVPFCIAGSLGAGAQAVRVSAVSTTQITVAELGGAAMTTNFTVHCIGGQ